MGSEEARYAAEACVCERTLGGGNRLLNEAIHTIALVQNRGVVPGKAYIDQRRANGKTHREAMRSRKDDSPTSSTASSSPTCNASKEPLFHDPLT